MSEILIMSYPKIEYAEDGSYSVATVFGNIPLICLNKIPKFAYSYIELKIEDVLTHETIAIVLEKFEDGLHKKFDKLFPTIESLRKLKGS